MKKDINQKILQLHKPQLRFSVIKAIQKRFSPRFYSDEIVKKTDLNSIFEAARWAPSGHNNQPWFFYYAKQESNSYKKLVQTMNPYNQSWAKTAPILILACAITKNDHGDNPFAFYDLGAAVISLILQSQSLGYYARQIGLFDKEKVKQIFKLNQDHQPYIIIALGKIGDYKKAPQEIVEYELAPRPRKTKIFTELIG